MAAFIICSDFGAQESKICHCSHFFPLLFAMNRCLDLVSECWVLNQLFSLSSLSFIKKLLSSSSVSVLEWYYLHIWGCWYFSWQSWLLLLIHPAWYFTSWTLHISCTSSMTIYSLALPLSKFWTSQLFHVRF